MMFCLISPPQKVSQLVVRVLALLAVLFSSNSAFAFRTAGDLPEFEGTEKVRWDNPIFRYEIYGDVPVGIVEGEAISEMVAGFKTWQDVSCSELSFSMEGASLSPAAPNDARNTVQWVHFGWVERGFAEDASAVSDLQYSKKANGWQIVEADLYLNADTQEWKVPGGSAELQRDIRAVIVHEAGHILGLFHPCELADALIGGGPICSGDESYKVSMNPAYSPDQSELAQDDINGACYLYPGVSCEFTGCAPGEECTKAGCLSACTQGLCAPDERCIGRECSSGGDIPVKCFGAGCGCLADADCPERLVCVEGDCTSGLGLLGDPCGEHVECQSSQCTRDGYCSAPCTLDKHCAVGAWSCQLEDRECVSDIAPFGAACLEANECIGERCLEGFSHRAVCTRECGAGLAECPLGWQCARVDELHVCVPPHASDDGCSCQVGGIHRGNMAANLLLLGAVAIRVFGRRRATRLMKI